MGNHGMELAQPAMRRKTTLLCYTWRLVTSRLEKFNEALITSFASLAVYLLPSSSDHSPHVDDTSTGMYDGGLDNRYTV